MSSKIKHTCNRIGCPNLTTEKYCPGCEDIYGRQEKRELDHQRGNAHQRGYDRKWGKKSKSFQRQPENQFCYIKGPNCRGLVEMTEHIDPPDGPEDPKFDDPENWGPSCIPCNSWKRDRSIDQLMIDEKAYFSQTGYDPKKFLKERKVGLLQK